ncbi:major facilitator superfamily domain-containing protein [Chytriomyces cf. hyalinus JEL632]|nr:major facilitator superfamily domain-containing protein [Chytriomyces cf. hyalinus JEL632]
MQQPQQLHSQPISSIASRRAVAFAHLDEASLGWFHVRAVLVAGVGFFTDSYDMFVISQALPMIYQVYYGSQYIQGEFPSEISNNSSNSSSSLAKTPQNVRLDFISAHPNGVHVDAWLKASTSWGNLVGQLGFGYLGDRLGRKRIYGVELVIMCVCTIGSALSSSLVQGFSVLVVLGLWRFCLGIGIGGDYPVSCVITAEFANVRYRGTMIAAVFAMQGVGILAGAIAYVATLAVFKPLVQADYKNLDYVWRITLGIGLIPALFAIYFRLTVPETPRFTADVMGATQTALNDIEQILIVNNIGTVTTSWGNETAHEFANKPVEKVSFFTDFKAYFGQRKNFKTLFATSYCWFALDVAWYGLAINQSTVLSLINFNGPSKMAVNVTIGNKTQLQYLTPPIDIWDFFHQTALGNVIISMAGTVPGYWFTVALIERMGRKPIQIMGFAIITACLGFMAVFWNTLSQQQVPFLIIFTIAQFFFQFGPNATTFVIPGEVFPTRFRSTGHGISAASGKFGAILGIQAVGPYFASNAVAVLGVFAVIMFSGLVATFWLPETAGRSLEEISREDRVVGGGASRRSGVGLSATNEVLLVQDDVDWALVQ